MPYILSVLKYNNALFYTTMDSINAFLMHSWI